MHKSVYRVLRDVQSRVPFVRSAKFGAYNFLKRHFGLFIDEEFHLLSRFTPVKLAIDIGGNWGQSIESLKRTCKPEKIVCFEPNPELSRNLERAYGRSSDVEICAKAISDAPGDFQLYVPQYRGFVYDGLASLDHQSAAGWLNADSVAWFDESKLRIVRHNVTAVTLDSLGLEPDVVKIDVQGLEAQVVRGGERTFSRSKPVTIIETPSQEVVSLLGDCGLSPYKYTKSELFAGDTSGLNTVFLGQHARERLGTELVVHASSGSGS